MRLKDAPKTGKFHEIRSQKRGTIEGQALLIVAIIDLLSPYNLGLRQQYRDPTWTNGDRRKFESVRSTNDIARLSDTYKV